MVIGGVSEGDRNVHSASLQPSMTKLPVQWSGKAHMPSGELIYSATKHGWSIAVGFVYVSYIQNKGACPPQKYDWIKIYIKQQKLCPALMSGGPSWAVGSHRFPHSYKLTCPPSAPLHTHVYSCGNRNGSHSWWQSCTHLKIGFLMFKKSRRTS